jgi:hypothetical protein
MLSRVIAGMMLTMSAGLFAWYLGILVERFLAKRVGVETPAMSGWEKIDWLVATIFVVAFIYLVLAAMPSRGQAQAGVIDQAPVVIGPRKPGIVDRRAVRWTAVAAMHIAAAYDASCTNRLVNEKPPTVPGYAPFWANAINPLLRPFAGRWSMYPATEALDSPLSVWLLKAKGSRNRKIAFAAVAAETGFHIAWGIYSTHLHNSQWDFYNAHVQYTQQIFDRPAQTGR